MIETVINRNLPDEFDGHYAWPGGENTYRNRFIELSPTRTKWTSTCACKFHGLFMKMMGFFCGGKIRGSHMTFLRNFKAFAEEGKDVRDSA